VAPMILLTLAIVAFGAVMIWWLVTRGPRATTVSRQDFDAEYDELVARGEAVETERDAAWASFHAAQVRDERERLAWEEGLGD
jgi:hypothetical protein